MKHQFINKGSVQWSKEGLGYMDACSTFECKNCLKTFKHYYHKEPNIYVALEEAGIKEDDCQVTQ